MIKVALAGNPNSGKTTLFNDLTGSRQYVGNWPGVTVQKKEGTLRRKKDVIITDLPGIYSLSPYTPEEVVTRNYLLKEQPSVILDIIDSTNIERNLYLTTQLIETGIPAVGVLNMMDLLEKRGDTIDIKKLSQLLKCEIVETSALKSKGSFEAADKAIELAKKQKTTIPQKIFADSLEAELLKIQQIIGDMVGQHQLRWYSIKLFERDKRILGELALSDNQKKVIEGIIKNYEKKAGDDSESIIINERYEFIGKVVKECVVKKNVFESTSDKIDKVLTDRWLALPIFALIIFVVYYVSVSSLGTIVTGWTNDVLFGKYIMGNLSVWFDSIGATAWINDLVVNGIIGGVGAVLGFVPQMFILFLLLSILEDCGYMSRIAFIMDKIFRKFGLSGKSFIPMLISSGCGVPGIMASKTIENEKDRRMTIITTTFIPCGAKLPVIALIGGAMFPGVVWMAPAVYFIGIAAVVVSGIMLKKTRLFAGDPSPFVLELPAYHVPSPRNLFMHVWEREKAFIIKAGTVIFVASGLIWFLSGFGFADSGFGMVGAESSLLADIGNIIAPIFAPLGFGNWKAAVATVSGLLAKENIVATFGVLFGLGSDVAEDNSGLLQELQSMFSFGGAAMAFLVFNMLCAPCFAAIGAIKREMASAKWTAFAIGYQTILAYAAALVVYQLSGWLGGHLSFGIGTVAAITVLVIMLYMLFRSNKYKV
ncbi:MAG: ferrous iron transport protein B [Clostridiales bacterium GWF2_38_85]|nr:MAG: ferrous iron transport protein B [Clostridiales bacterium GWF2_38_85]HBL83830.1 ferrous iron transport protein B [Clostridiales bacterium]